MIHGSGLCCGTLESCVETSIGNGGNADRMLRAFADLYRGGRCAFTSQWNRPRLELNLCKAAETVLDRRRMLRVWQTPDIAWREVIERRHKDRTFTESLEFRQDVIAWRRRIFMILGLISALLTLVYMYFCTIIIARYYIMFITIYAIFFRCSKLRSSVFAQSTEILNIQFFIHRIIEWFKNYTL